MSTPAAGQARSQIIGFIGLGKMGTPMARNVRRAGFPLVVYHRVAERAAAFAEIGATVAESPRAVAGAADVVVLMLSDSAAVRDVVLSDSGVLHGLRPAAVLIDMSTIAPAVSREVAAAVAARGAHMLDAPVSGSTGVAEQGQLSIMIGGDAAVIDRVRDVLLAMGSRLTHVGPAGAGAALKLAVNVVGGLTMQALAEALALAEAAGVTPETALDVLSNGALASPFLKFKASQLLQPLGPAAFTTAMMQKDFTLALQLARDVGVPLPATAAANKVVTIARAMGLGEHDFAAVAEVMRRLSAR
jgi:3-hydroxyisobutyrate dehydrogenase-like beta-hydroxyacid dehydrogenase